MSREDEINEKICCTGNLSLFCLGMTDYNCCGIPELRHKKLSLSWKIKPMKLKPLSPSAHFNTTVSSKEIETSLKGCVPVGTAKSTNWVVCTFQQWLMQKNKRVLPLSMVLQKAFPLDYTPKRISYGGLARSFTTEVEKLHSVQQSPYLSSPQLLFPPDNASAITTMPTTSPHINSSGNCTINFTVNVCPSGNFGIGNVQRSSKGNYQYLFDDLDVDDLFTMT